MTVHQKWPFTVGIHFTGGFAGLFCVGKITIKSLPNSFTLWKLVFFCKLEISYTSSTKQFSRVPSEIKYFVGLPVELRLIKEGLEDLRDICVIEARSVSFHIFIAPAGLWARPGHSETTIKLLTVFLTQCGITAEFGFYLAFPGTFSFPKENVNSPGSAKKRRCRDLNKLCWIWVAGDNPQPVQHLYPVVLVL